MRRRSQQPGQLHARFGKPVFVTRGSRGLVAVDHARPLRDSRHPGPRPGGYRGRGGQRPGGNRPGPGCRMRHRGGRAVGQLRRRSDHPEAESDRDRLPRRDPGHRPRAGLRLSARSWRRIPGARVTFRERSSRPSASSPRAFGSRTPSSTTTGPSRRSGRDGTSSWNP